MKFILSTFLFFVSVSSIAESGFSQTGTIDEMYNHAGSVMIGLSGTNPDFGDECPSKAHYALQVSKDEANKLIFSQMLMAHASGMEVRLWINGDVCSGQENNYPTIYSIKTYR